jgi:hypothetical protein
MNGKKSFVGVNSGHPKFISRKADHSKNTLSFSLVNLKKELPRNLQKIASCVLLPLLLLLCLYIYIAGISV